MSPFHLAIPVVNFQETKQFYRDLFSVVVGRETEQWVDFNFYGHQLSAHVSSHAVGASKPNNMVDGKRVPIIPFTVEFSDLLQLSHDRITYPK